MSDPSKSPEPLPIWFFVGVILLVYGLLLMASDFLYGVGSTVLASTRPCLWWGGVTALCGAVFLGVGLRVHAADKASRKEEQS
jgi:hypothetical protein